MGIGSLVFETMRRWKRKTVRRKSDPNSKPTSEDWEMSGYLYHARCYQAHNPSPLPSPWPFAWVWESLKLKDEFYVKHAGMDAAAYVRVIRGCFYFTLSQVLTVMPILLTVHITHSPDTILKTDMTRASLSALVADAANVHLLWIHTCLLSVDGMGLV